jgi:hypothetical protein
LNRLLRADKAESWEFFAWERRYSAARVDFKALPGTASCPPPLIDPSAPGASGSNASFDVASMDRRDRPVVNRALGGGPSEVDGARLAD